jgi:hypothetical protein
VQAGIKRVNALNQVPATYYTSYSEADPGPRYGDVHMYRRLGKLPINHGLCWQGGHSRSNGRRRRLYNTNDGSLEQFSLPGLHQDTWRPAGQFHKELVSSLTLHSQYWQCSGGKNWRRGDSWRVSHMGLVTWVVARVTIFRTSKGSELKVPIPKVEP